MWLAATDGEEEGVWRDYYSRERMDNYTQTWNSGVCMIQLTKFNLIINHLCH